MQAGGSSDDDGSDGSSTSVASAMADDVLLLDVGAKTPELAAAAPAPFQSPSALGAVRRRKA